ncbi:MAG: hypothetical protein BWK76_07195 [Desulfobulbaceae bacterium A2]|nr:MAG: hypothetical protein BWK76_07195 [Desulfobulbaceae bacterium A2]
MQAEQTEPQGRYRLRGYHEILEKLTVVWQKNCQLRTKLKGIPVPFVTTVVEILPEKDRLLLNVSAQPQVNLLLPEMENIQFVAQVDGIQCRFTVERLLEGEWEGRRVFIASLPSSLLWQQQRAIFRVVVPLALPARCQVSMRGDVFDFPVLDMSVVGMALRDDEMQFDEAYEPGFRFDKCRLILPETGEVELGIEVRNKVSMAGARRVFGQRVGCSFVGVSRSAAVLLQRFVFSIELLEKREAPW